MSPFLGLLVSQRLELVLSYVGNPLVWLAATNIHFNRRVLVTWASP